MACKVYVIGMGMGNPRMLTVQARDALEQSELIIGSPRLLEALGNRGVPMVALVAPDAIAERLRQGEARVASVVMSGDVGLYSGATRLYERLHDMEVEAIPGISSLVYLCARLQVPWQDVLVVSAHGRRHDVVGAVQSHARVFVLAGGSVTPDHLCEQLVTRGLGHVSVWVGERLSYEDERVTHGTASELVRERFDQLSVMLVENDHPVVRPSAVPHLADEDFVRGKVPMTKEEVRKVILSKLDVRPTSVVWDVGAGTGSVSMEAAFAACEGLVCAVERNEEALALLERNKAVLDLPNVRIVAGEAPEALRGLPVPDRVFVGGSSGRLRAILEAALDANPRVRLCVAAITLETLSETLSCMAELAVTGVDIAQIAVAKAHEVGSYHLVRGGNPVYVISAHGLAGEEVDHAR